MMFDVYTVSQILAGNKTVTRRMPGKRVPAVEGKVHRLKIDRTEKAYGLILINSVTIEPLSNVTDDEAIKEGFNNRRHYLNYFKHLNGDVDEENQLVWRISFEYLGI